jgi:pimeloyl-ACP methyl ester carboxylesterase
VPFLTHDGVEIHWTERGDPSSPDAPLVLVHGLFLSSKMFERLAAELEHRWIIMVDVRGHGGSTELFDPAAYSWAGMVSDVHAVIDRLDIDKAIVGGTSLGADVALMYGVAHPERTAGMVIEMPVLFESEGYANSVFRPAAYVLSCGAPLLGPVMHTIGRLPAPRVPEVMMLRDVLSRNPRSFAAVLRGLLQSEQPNPAALATIIAPTLVIGHHNDRLHAIADAHHLVRDIRDGEMVEAPSFMHYRLHVAELAELIDDFLTRHNI